MNTYEEISQIIREDVGKSPEEIFQSIDKNPIASASIA